MALNFSTDTTGPTLTEDPRVITVDELREQIGGPAATDTNADSYTPDETLEHIIERTVEEAIHSFEEQIQQQRPAGELAHHVEKVEVDLSSEGEVAEGEIPAAYMPFSFDWGLIDGQRAEQKDDVRFHAQNNPFSPKGYQITGRRVEVVPDSADAIELKLIQKQVAREAFLKTKMSEVNDRIYKRAASVVKARTKQKQQIDQDNVQNAPSI